MYITSKILVRQVLVAQATLELHAIYDTNKT